MYLYYTFGYLTLEQEYVCENGRKCSVDEICANKLDYQVDTTS
jgi:hypothetical protein